MRRKEMLLVRLECGPICVTGAVLIVDVADPQMAQIGDTLSIECRTCRSIRNGDSLSTFIVDVYHLAKRTRSKRHGVTSRCAVVEFDNSRILRKRKVCVSDIKIIIGVDASAKVDLATTCFDRRRRSR